jgi:hypothetical protein
MLAAHCVARPHDAASCNERVLQMNSRCCQATHYFHLAAAGEQAVDKSNLVHFMPSTPRK